MNLGDGLPARAHRLRQQIPPATEGLRVREGSTIFCLGRPAASLDATQELANLNFMGLKFDFSPRSVLEEVVVVEGSLLLQFPLVGHNCVDITDYRRLVERRWLDYRFNTVVARVNTVVARVNTVFSAASSRWFADSQVAVVSVSLLEDFPAGGAHHAGGAPVGGCSVHPLYDNELVHQQ